MQIQYVQEIAGIFCWLPLDCRLKRSELKSNKHHMIHQIFSLAYNWFDRIMWLNMPQLKLSNIQVIFPNFKNHMFCAKYLKANKHDGLHIALKYIMNSLIWTDICLQTSSVPKIGQISKYISEPYEGCCLYIKASCKQP